MDHIVLYPSHVSDRRLGIELTFRAAMLFVKEDTHVAMYDAKRFVPDNWCVLITDTGRWLAPTTTREMDRWQDTVLGVARPKDILALFVGRLEPGEVWNSNCLRIRPVPPATPKETPRERPPSTSKPVSARPANDFDSLHAKYRAEKDMIELGNSMIRNWRPSGPW